SQKKFWPSVNAGALIGARPRGISGAPPTLDETRQSLRFELPRMNIQSPSRLRRLFGSRTNRLIGYLLILAAVAAWKYIPRPWHPTVTMETAHYAIASTATRAQTEEIARVAEELYLAYSN